MSSHAALNASHVHLWMSLRLWIVFVLAYVAAGSACLIAADLYVDPILGDDATNGVERPFRTIAAAIRQAVPGDTIHLLPRTVYRDWAAFFDKSGEPGHPITLDGHGATLDGCDLLPADGWIETEPGLYRHDDLMPLTDAIIDRYFFVINGQLNRMQRCSKGPSEPLKSPQDLQPGEWTFVKDQDRTKSAREGYIFGTFWLKLVTDQALADAKIEYPTRPAGVLIRGVSSHLVVRNLTATRPYNDGFNLSDSRDVRFENIRAIHCGDDGISAHGHCQYSVDGFESIGNATGICDTGTSETSYRHVLIRDCIGFDLFFLDSGKYSVRDAEVFSSAAKSLYLQGRESPAEPCRVSLSNVVIHRERNASDVRVSANCVLKADRVSLLGLDLQATGGEIEMQRSLVGGTVPGNPPRKPTLHLWKGARWRGADNWYDLGSARVADATYTETKREEFSRSVASDQASRWCAVNDEEVKQAGIGATRFPAAAAEIALASEGKSTYVIVTPVQPTPEEATAAEWLATALKQVTGADFPIRKEHDPSLPQTCVYVGDTRAAQDSGLLRDSLKSEEWHVRTAKQSLILAGGRPRGTIYAVTEFLEAAIGVLMLDPFTEVVPSRPTLTLPKLDRAGRPAFPVRAIFTGFPYGYPAQAGRLMEKFRVWNKNVIDGREAVGGHPRVIPTGVHSFGNFISSKEFAASHPEYFGMDAAGKRLTDDMGTPSAWTQLCMTNADVRRITLERAKQFLLEDRAAAAKESREPSHWLVLSQNDNTANLCLCPDCKAVVDREGSESGPLMEFVNHVARGLKDEFPDVLVQTEAYNFTINPPKTIRPESNVVVRYCDNYGMSDLTHPLSHSRNDRMKNIFSAWQETQCQLGVWDYWRVFQQHPPGFFAPSTNVTAIRDDVRLFQKSGVQLLTIEIEDLFGAGINAEPASADVQSFMPLRTWIGLKLIDDPDKDLNKLIDTFCQGYYGPAAEPMRKLLDRIEQKQQELPLRVVDVQRQVWAEAFCDAAFFTEAYQRLNEAIAATADDPVMQTHVRRERIVIDSAFLWLEQHVREAVPSIIFPDRAEILRRHREDWNAYIATVFDNDGQKLAMPIIETGLALAEKLKAEDTAFEHRPVAIAESDVTLDGQLTEPFWQTIRASRLLPRDPAQPNDDPTSIRLAWTPDALYVRVEQPADRSSAILGVTLMEANRKGVQLSLYATRNNGPQSLNAYFYDYDPDGGGLRVVKDRKTNSQSIESITDSKVTTELRFLWSDIDVTLNPETDGSIAHDFVFNIESYPQPDSKVPSLVSSPWLIGTSPTWHSGYYKSLRLGNAKP